MTNKGAHGFNRIIRATGYSLAGLRKALGNKTTFKKKVQATVLLTPVALWLGENNVETAVLLASLILALIVELLHVAIESKVNRVNREGHDISTRAKDVTSAAVFLSMLNVAIVWTLLLTN